MHCYIVWVLRQVECNLLIGVAHVRIGIMDYPDQLLPLANEGNFSEGLVRTLRFNFEQSGVETLYRELEHFVDREMASRESVNFNFTSGAGATQLITSNPQTMTSGTVAFQVRSLGVTGTDTYTPSINGFNPLAGTNTTCTISVQ